MSNALRKIGRLWLKFATILGTLQMIFLLSVIYWTMVAITAIPMKLLSDPLALRHSKRGWIKREPVEDMLKSMTKQG